LKEKLKTYSESFSELASHGLNSIQQVSGNWS